MANAPTPSLLRSKLFWVGILYFAEGFPLGLFYDLLPVHFRQQGIALSEIGFLSLLGLAWTLKFLWAPAVDYWRHHRLWLAAAEMGMGLCMLGLAIHVEFSPWTWLAVGLFTLLSATNDIATDGYTIEQLDRRELGVANGLRIALYRVGMLAAGALLMLSDLLGWKVTYVAAAGLFSALALLVLRAPPERDLPGRRGDVVEELRGLSRHPLAAGAVTLLVLGAVALADRSLHFAATVQGFWIYALALGALPVLLAALRRESGSAQPVRPAAEGPMFGALLTLLRRPGMLPVILFILLFKLGDAAMGFMVKPFWVDAGFSASQIGLVSVNIGLGLSIAGGVAGGWLTDRLGIFRSLWLLGFAQAFSNLGYAGAAWLLPIGSGTVPGWEHQLLIYGASGLESFTGGLGTAAFLAFLMAIVDKERAASEYALLSSVFALSRSVAGWAGGFGAQAWGYAPYFLLTFFLSFPAYLLLLWVKRMLEMRASDGDPGQG